MPESLNVRTEPLLFLCVLVDTLVHDFPSFLAEALDAACHLLVVLGLLHSDL